MSGLMWDLKIGLPFVILFAYPAWRIARWMLPYEERSDEQE